ncbi:hypothetical protein IIE18_27980 [Pseudomonas sp. V1]|uniref:RHS repeat domain-containing protein n=1 Tax=Pseudomonas arcuscaelestis TaxID=2710591 RepID=UPI00193F74CD|nr:RHS repeat-associated core domain-containing protein [Pseudomonas arcuscaelestis]MBM3108959.1 hypothetical protein [Pseudomonas arcuscaelestis]
METFAYDVRGRLVTYTAEPSVAPEDPFGNRIIKQSFTFNRFDGYEQVVSAFANNSEDTATYTYGNPEDPTQVTVISHTHASWKVKRIDLTYDACGRVIKDSLGRNMTWDAQDRLTRVDYDSKACVYGYDPSGNLCDRLLDGTLTRSFFSAGQLTHEQCNDEILEVLDDGGTLFALNRITAGVRTTTLIGSDAQGSVRIEADSELRSRHYSPHGVESSGESNGPFGYTGERREPLTGWHIPAGYRPYDPILMMFLSPDSDSPFGRGGLNPYAYCGGDPINRIDPDGHAWWEWALVAVSIALGTAAFIASVGTAAPLVVGLVGGQTLTASAAMSIGAAASGAISLATGIAEASLAASNKLGGGNAALGWISLVTGTAGAALEFGPKLIQMTTKFKRVVGRGYDKLMTSKRVPWGPDDSLRYGKGNSAFIGKVWGRDDPAYLADLVGPTTIKNLEGVPRTPIQLAADLTPYLSQVAQERPLLLIVNNSARSGYAQELANHLKRPVSGFDDVVKTSGPRSLTKPLKPLGDPGSRNWLGNHVKSPAGPGDAWMPITPGQADMRPAKARLFNPIATGR